MTKSAHTMRNLIIAGFVLMLSGIIFLAYRNHQLADHLEKLQHADTTQPPAPNIAAATPMQQIDELLFQGQYTAALKAYQELQADSADTSSAADLIARMAITRSLLSHASPSKIERPIAESRDSSLKSSTIPSNQEVAKASGSQKNTDSLEHRITQLNRQLSSRERALEEKEQLKAIAIQGGDGQTIQYVGDTRNGMAHGTGTGVWDASGGTYNGDWQENKRHGYGVYNWKDGVRYEGDFRQDKREGKGAYYWPSGERYVGQWKNNQRNGSGVLYDKDGNISYEGNWENDKPKRK